jgi:oligopeptide/dipeptide ABC transporter ATP-binding protein
MTSDRTTAGSNGTSSGKARTADRSRRSAPDSGADAILSVRDARVTFEMDRGESSVLNGVDIDVYRGEILAVVGESGSGKSMFASALLDAVVDPGRLTGEVLYRPHEGSPVSVLELDESSLRALRWQRLSMVFQGAMSSFNPTMKLRGGFEETIEAHGEPLDERMAFARTLLTALNLDPDRVFQSYPHELSGGMKQRALIALALVLDPDVLVMDEPTAALDLLMQRSIINMLRDLRDALDLTIVFITHDLPLVAGLSDRVAVMYAGEFVEVGPTPAVLRDAAHPYTRALLRSVPGIDSAVDEMTPIDGQSPDPVNVPAGCSYHPRCPLADGDCETADPPLSESATHGADRRVACHYADRAADAIAYELHGARPDAGRSQLPTQSRAQRRTQDPGRGRPRGGEVDR